MLSALAIYTPGNMMCAFGKTLICKSKNGCNIRYDAYDTDILIAYDIAWIYT